MPRKGEPLSEFGLRVKQRLVAMGWTQGDLAKQLGAWHQGVSQKLRSKEPTLATVEGFARVLGLHPKRLDSSYMRRKRDAKIVEAREERRRRDASNE